MLLLVLLLLISSISAFQLTTNRVVRPKLAMAAVGPKDTKKSIGEAIKKAFLPLALGAVLFTSPGIQPAEAASSGGRSGGSSFRSMPRGGGGYGRSSTRLGAGTGYSRGYGSSTYITPMPFYSPFSPFGFSPFGFMPVNFNLLVIGFIAYTALNILSNRAGGADFSNSGDEGSSLGGGATVIRLNVALDSDWAQQGNIMTILTTISQRNSMMAGRGELAKLASDASLALLRKQSEWNSAAYESQRYGGFGQASMSTLESDFQRQAVVERSKFEEETDGAGYAAIKSSEEIAGSRPTKCVVSILVAVRGNSAANMARVDGAADVRACLQNLASDALTDDGDNIMGVEVLWTPSVPGTSISERELVNDYPELMRL